MTEDIAFRKARAADLPAIGMIYEAIHTREEAGQSSIGWLRGIYPTMETASAAIGRKDMYVAEANGHIAGCAIINSDQHPRYADGDWRIAASAEHVLVLHTLVISPAWQGKGIGALFVGFYEEMAKKLGMRSLRMDTNAINGHARKLYERLGYREAGSIHVEFNGIPDLTLILLEKEVS